MVGAVTCIAVRSEDIYHLPTDVSAISQLSQSDLSWDAAKGILKKQNPHDFKTTDLKLNVYFILQKGKKSLLFNKISSMNLRWVLLIWYALPFNESNSLMPELARPISLAISHPLIPLICSVSENALWPRVSIHITLALRIDCILREARWMLVLVLDSYLKVELFHCSWLRSKNFFLKVFKTLWSTCSLNYWILIEKKVQ